MQSSVSADSVDSSDYGCLCDFVIRLSQRYEFTAAVLFADSVDSLDVVDSMDSVNSGECG